MCYSIVFFENCMSLASILSIFMISLERFYVICKPLKVKSIMTQSHTLKIIAFIWCLSIVVNMPFIFLAEYKKALFYDNNKLEYKCSSVAGNKWTVIYSITVTFIVFVIIGIILSWMFHKISQSLKNSTKAFLAPGSNSSCQHSKRNSSNKEFIPMVKREYELIPLKRNESEPIFKPNFLSQNEVSLNATSQTQSGSFSSIQKPEVTLLNINSDIEKYIKPRRQLIKMLMCVIVVFYICFFPLKMWVFILMCFGSRPWFLRVIQFKQYWYISITCRVFFYANSSLNPILYNCLSKKFRQSFKRLWLFKYFFKSASQTNPEFRSKKSNTCSISEQTRTELSTINRLRM